MTDTVAPCRIRLPWRPVVALTLALAVAVPALAKEAWIGTWTASPQPTWDAGFAFPTKVPPVLRDRTVRQIARISLGGKRIRIVLSNEYGKTPLVIGNARVALARDGSAIEPGTGRPLTFGGEPSVVVPPGAPIVSDPVDLAVKPLTRVAVSIHLPEPTGPATFHWDGRQTAYITEGDEVAAEKLDAAATTDVRLFLSGIQVEAESPAGVVVVLGDSITDGNGATVDADTRWPDFLAARLVPRNAAVLNAGISGARLLGNRMGDNALARFDRDVLSRPLVRSVIVLLGTNDISWPGTAFDPEGARPSPGTLIAAYRQLIARAHARGIRIIGATLPPFRGALAGTPLDDYHDEDKDRLRRRINAWIRSSGEFDAVIDFDRLLRDPERPARLRPEFDSGDHLHPGDRGNEAMAGHIDPDTLLTTSRQ